MADVQQRRVELVRVAFQDHVVSSAEVYGEFIGDWMALTPHMQSDTPGLTGIWTVTHVASGRRIPVGEGVCLPHGRAVAEALDAFGVDWSRHFGDIKADEPPVAAALKAARRVADECHGHTCSGP